MAGAAGLVTAYTAGAVNMNATWDPENGLEGGVGFGVGGAANVGLSYSKEGGYGGDVGVQLGEVATVGVSYNQTEGAGVNASLSGIDSLEGAGLNLRYTQNTGLSGGVSYSAGGATGGLSYSQEEGVGANLSYTDEIAENTSATGSLSWTQNSGTSANVSANWRGTGKDRGEGPPKFNDGFDGFGGGVGWNQNDGLNANVSVGGTNAFNYDEANGWTGNANYEQNHFEKERTEYIKDVQDYNRKEAAKELKQETDKIRDILAEKTGKSPEELAGMTEQELHDLAKETPGGMEALSDADYEFDVGGSRDEGWFSGMMGGIVDNVVNSFGGASSDLLVKSENGKFKVKTCFVAGTKVWVRDENGDIAFKEIQDVQAGDYAWACDQNNVTDCGWNRVVETYVRESNSIYIIRYVDGSVLETTWNHPFYIEGYGFMNAEDLKPGHNSRTTNGSLEIESIVIEKRHETVYNFQVEKAHTYHVGEIGVLVHNDEGYVKAFGDEMYKRTVGLIEKARTDPAGFAKEVLENQAKYSAMFLFCLACQQAMEAVDLGKEVLAATGAQGKEEAARAHARLTLKAGEVGATYAGGRALTKVLSGVQTPAGNAVKGGAETTKKASGTMAGKGATPGFNKTQHGSLGGKRAGKDFTPKGKREVIDANQAKNRGQTVCETCGVDTVPAAKSQKGVKPPRNETQVDHVHPKSKGGDGSPSNGQVLCRDCNREKSNK